MSTDTIALYEVENSENALKLILSNITNSDLPTFDKAEKLFSSLWLENEWKFDEGKDLESPSGFHISGKGKIVSAYHLLRYSSFTLQEENGKIVKEAFEIIGRIIGAKRMLIHHELLPINGDGLDEISENLTNNIGVAAKSWDELHDADYFDEKCWLMAEISEN